MQLPPDFVVIGHITQDLQPDGSFLLGGTVTYTALLALQLGLTVGVVTSGTPREVADFLAAMPNALVACTPATTPTIFENHYVGGSRQQVLRARAAPLVAAAVPDAWRSAPIALLGPVAAEVDASVATCLTSPLRAATPQGWLRGWDTEGRIYATAWHAANAVLPHLGALVCSVEDVAMAAGGAPAAGVIAAWAAQVPVVVITDGPRGANVHQQGQPPQHVPAFVVEELDPTGAGDVFTAAFLIARWRGKDALAAVRYAHAAASYVVAAPGISGMPTETQIAARLRA
jgi:hypothetical protein